MIGRAARIARINVRSRWIQTRIKCHKRRDIKYRTSDKFSRTSPSCEKAATLRWKAAKPASCMVLRFFVLSSDLRSFKRGSAGDCRTYGSFRDQGQADRAQCLAHDQDAEETYSPFPENVKKQRAAQGVVADSFGT